MKRILKSLLLIILALVMCISIPSCKKKEEQSKVPDDALCSYGEYYVNEPLYSYWLSRYKYYFLTSYNGGSDTAEFWDTLIDDETTYDEYVTELVCDEVKNRTVALSLFDEYGLTWTDAMEQEIDNDIEDKIANVGSRKEMNEELGDKLNMNIDMLREVYIINKKYDMVTDHLYGENGTERASEEEKAAYYNESYYCLKLITLYTDYIPEKDDEGNYIYGDDGKLSLVALTEEEIAQKEELLAQIERELSEGADFDECSKKYSEIDYSSTPHGILVSEQDYTSYGADVISAAVELEVGEYRTLRDDVSTLIVMKTELPGYTELTETERSTLTDIADRVESKKKSEKFAALTGEMTLNTAITDKYSIRDISRNSYY